MSGKGIAAFQVSLLTSVCILCQMQKYTQHYHTDHLIQIIKLCLACQ